MYRIHQQCRACHSRELQPVFDLGTQPLANDFREEGQWRNAKYPLCVLFCTKCSLPQLSVVVKPEILYDHYHYITDSSKLMDEHFDRLIGDLNGIGGIMGDVLEIGSNDGRFLRHLTKARRTVGVEPAVNLARKANMLGTFTIVDFFNEACAARISRSEGTFDTIIARHVFCHLDDWHGTMRAILPLLSEGGMLYLEFPYVLDTMQVGSFDQIYHEHLSYAAILPIVGLLQQYQMRLRAIRQYSIHGGSMGLFCSKGGHTDSVEDIIRERERQENSLDGWNGFYVRSRQAIDRLGNLVRELNANGKRVAGYGAPAKATVLVNACQLDADMIQFITDTTPSKIGTQLPGTRIPIVDPGAILREKPDYCILFAWTYKDQILSRERIYREGGGKFIMPLTGEIA